MWQDILKNENLINIEIDYGTGVKNFSVKGNSHYNGYPTIGHLHDAVGEVIGRHNGVEPTGDGTPIKVTIGDKTVTEKANGDIEDIEELVALVEDEIKYTINRISTKQKWNEKDAEWFEREKGADVKNPFRGE